MVRFGRRRRRLTPLVGVAVASLMAASTAGPAAAAPDTAQANPPDRVADRLSATSDQAQRHDVTLVTGDTVHVSVAADGAYSATVDLAPRADGRQVFTQVLTRRRASAARGWTAPAATGGPHDG